MINYTDKDKRSELSLRIGTHDSFTYDEIKTLQKDGILEDYDLFRINSDYQNQLRVYYLNGKYYLITSSQRTARLIPEDLLRDRTFEVATGSVTNNVQHLLQVKGTEALDGISEEELIRIILGSDYVPVKQIDIEDLAQELGLDER